MPEAVAELARETAGWRFMNFHYPEIKGDLLAVLPELRESRGKQ